MDFPGRESAPDFQQLMAANAVSSACCDAKN